MPDTHLEELAARIVSQSGIDPERCEQHLAKFLHDCRALDEQLLQQRYRQPVQTFVDALRRIGQERTSDKTPSEVVAEASGELGTRAWSSGVELDNLIGLMPPGARIVRITIDAITLSTGAVLTRQQVRMAGKPGAVSTERWMAQFSDADIERLRKADKCAAW